MLSAMALLAVALLTLAVYTAVTNQFRVEESVNIYGKTFKHVNYIDFDSGSMVQPAGGVPAAKTGTLTTRTDNTSGTITGQAGHGITTGNKIDIYWTGGYRANVTAGTVSGNSIPFSLGSGSNLPSATTVLTLMKPQVEAIAIDGDQVTGIVANCDAAGGTVTFLDGSDVVIGSPIPLTLPDDVTAYGATYVWTAEKGTSPIAGSVAASVRLSHSSSGGAKGMTVAVVRN